MVSTAAISCYAVTKPFFVNNNGIKINKENYYQHLDILFIEISKFPPGISDLFSLTYRRTFCRLTGTSRVKSFSSWQTVFSIIRMLISNLSLKEPARFLFFPSVFSHLRFFQALELFKVSVFLPFSVLITDWFLFVQRFFLVLNAYGNGSSCEQTNSSMNSMFSSIEAVVRGPEPSLLSIEPVSLNFFNRHLTKEWPHFLDGWCFQIL